MQLNEAADVSTRCKTADDQEIIDAHKVLNEFVDKIQAGGHPGVSAAELQSTKRRRVLLKSEMQFRKIGPFANRVELAA